MSRWGILRISSICVTAALAGCTGSADSSRTPAPTIVQRHMPANGGSVNGPVAAKAKTARTAADTASEPASLRMSPKSVTLSPGDPGVQMLVHGEGPASGGEDLTPRIVWSVDPSACVMVDQGGYIRPRRSGTATVQASLGDRRGTVSVTVEGAERPWDFGEDIVPILTKAGCNTGGCHGKADGQNGFHLSLFGYDPSGDYRALTREQGGRRLSPLAPDRSLLVQKASGRVPHGGGLRLAPTSTECQTLVAWIKAGAPERRGNVHGKVAELTVEPASVRLDEPGRQQLRVIARYADGHRRDVTRQSVLRALDDSAARVDARGLVTLLRRAETDLVVRYQTRVVSTRVATLINPGPLISLAKRRRQNFIDDELFKRLEALNVPPSPPASDAAFLRRVTLDLTGQLPSPERIRQFLADKEPGKREMLVDDLLASRDFVLFWRIKFGDLLQISTARLGNGSTRFQTWVDDSLVKNTAWDVMVRTMLTAVGKPEDNLEGGPVNYALDGPDAKTRAEQTAQRFLGLRIRCAQCHDHPFDVWTQDAYFGLAACFAKVERSGGMAGKTVVSINPNGKVEHPRTKQLAEPTLLDGTAVRVGKKDDPRKPLADWMTAADNPYFARAMTNWIWAQFFGKGLADPPDDLSRSNPPVHPELLDALARHFVEHHFDLRDLIRTIATSEAYGLSSSTVPGNERDGRLFSHQVPRPLSAHQMADALAQATDVPNRYPNRAKMTRAIEVADPATASTILDTFGRCSRAIGCTSVSTPPLSLRQSLLLIGGDVIEGKVSHLQGYLANLISDDLKPEPEDIVENLYYRTVCRPPTAEELSHWSAELKGASSLREAAEDLFWALLNSREFGFNH
jgi:hypothetical protein